jgi:hypothetical protein
MPLPEVELFTNLQRLPHQPCAGNHPSSPRQEGENYFFWLFKCDLLTELDKIELAREMYMNTNPLKGKYRYASVVFVEIKRKDPSYYDWMKRTWSDAFVKYLP